MNKSSVHQRGWGDYVTTGLTAVAVGWVLFALQSLFGAGGMAINGTWW